MRRELAAATAVFGLLTVVFTYPMSVRAGSVLLADQPDLHLFLWTLGWIAHALVTDPLALFDANIFHPLRYTLAFSENLLGSGLLAAPIIWLTGNHVLALNLVSLLSVVLCGAGAYLLARTMGLGIAAAFICGIIFAFSPPRFFRLGQLHLTTVQWIPFALAFLHSYLEAGRARDLKLAIAFFSLQAVTSGHGAIFLAVAIAFVLIHHAARRRPIALLQRVRDAGISGALLMLPAVLIALPYRIVQREMGLRRSLENWTVAPVSFIASPSRLHQALLDPFIPVADVTAVAHAYLFPGYLPLLMPLLVLIVPRAVAKGWRPAGYRWLYGILAVFSFMLAVGPPLSPWPLIYWLPGFNFIRVPSRFLILTVLSLAVLSAIAFQGVREHLTARGWPQRRLHWLTATTVVLLLLEFSTIPMSVAPFSTRAAAAEAWLAEQPGPIVVAEVPLTGIPRDQSIYVVHSMTHWRPTVHGYSGFEPPAHTELYGLMRSFPGPASLNAMRARGVTHLVVHMDRFNEAQREEIVRQLASASGVELLFQEMKSRVYRLRAAP